MSPGDWTDEHIQEARDAYEGYSNNDQPLTGSNTTRSSGDDDDEEVTGEVPHIENDRLFDDDNLNCQCRRCAEKRMR